MLYRKIDFTFWVATLFKRALKCITLNQMKKSLVHYGDNAREHKFPLYLKKISCFEEMLYLVFASTKN